jgi:hypothetical protein
MLRTGLAYARTWIAPIAVAFGAGTTAVCSIVGASGDLSQLLAKLPGKIGLAGFGVFLIASVIDIRDRVRTSDLRRRISTLSGENSDLRTQLTHRQRAVDELFRGNLSILAEKAGCEATERVSIYKSRNDGAFRIVGRYSAHHDYDHVHRTVHEHGQGLVSRVWTTGNDETAEVSADPGVDMAAYCQEQHAKFAIPLAVAAQFTMRSRSYAAFAIPDHDATRRIGVIIFESTLSGRFAGTRVYKVKRAVEEALLRLQFFARAANENQTFLSDEQRQHAT